MMTFSFRPTSGSRLGVDRRVGEHPGRLLEGGRRQPRLGGQRRLGDTHEHRAAGGGLAALGDHRRFSASNRARSTSSPGRNSVSPDSSTFTRLQHLADDDLDVLVVDRHALRAVDLLDLVDQVQLHRTRAHDAQHLVRVDGAVVQLLADVDVARRPRPAARRAWAPGTAISSLPSSGMTTIFRDLLRRPRSGSGRRPRLIGAHPWGCAPRTAPAHAADRA